MTYVWTEDGVQSEATQSSFGDLHVSFSKDQENSARWTDVTRYFNQFTGGSVIGTGSRALMSGGGSSYTLHCYVKVDVTLTLLQ